MTHTPTANPAPSRLCRLAGLFALTALVVLSSQDPLGAQKYKNDRKFRIERKTKEDPVDEFRRALLLEAKNDRKYRNDLRGKALEYALDFRRKNLTRAANNLRNLSDISYALLLFEWPRVERSDLLRESEPPYDRGYFDEKKGKRMPGAREIEKEVRDKLTERFVKLSREAFKEGSYARQEAVANLVGETANTAATELKDERLTLYDGLAPLAKDLVRLTRSPSANVRVAAARSLGQFPKEPAVTVPGLRRMLDPKQDRSVVARRAAAEALISLVQTVTGRTPSRSSEPGVMVRESRRTSEQGLFTTEELAAVLAHVVPASAQAVTDADPEVRRLSTAALHQAAEGLALELRYAIPLEELVFPPPNRPWDDAEKRRVQEGRKAVGEIERRFRPALLALTRTRDPEGGLSVREALLRATTDPDNRVRLNASLTFDELARARRSLLQLRQSVPIPTKEEVRRHRPSPNQRTGAAEIPPARLPLLPVSATLRQDDKGKDGKDEEELDSDALGKMLSSLARDVSARGLTDPGVKGRRGAIEALEAMGETARPFIPSMIRALKDRDRFVRWIAARALGKLAPAGAARAVPALVCILDDDDLDLRITAAKAIGEYGPDAARALPELIAKVNTGDAEFRIAVMRALEAIGKDATRALPAIARSLRERDPRLRAEAARVLGEFGSASRAYLEELTRLINDPDSEVRRSASAAIINITEDEEKE